MYSRKIEKVKKIPFQNTLLYILPLSFLPIDENDWG